MPPVYYRCFILQYISALLHCITYQYTFTMGIEPMTLALLFFGSDLAILNWNYSQYFS